MRAPSWLSHAALRSSDEAWTLGSAMADYCRSESVTQDQLSTELGCDAETFAWLSLCRAPAPERFAEDVSRIAERFGVDATKLAGVVRRVHALTVLRRPRVSEEERTLLAARDRQDEEDK